MFDLDHDMDDLFQRAGNDYPLHTVPANWNSVNQRVLSALINASNMKRQSRYRFIAVSVSAAVMAMLMVLPFQTGPDKIVILPKRSLENVVTLIKVVSQRHSLPFRSNVVLRYPRVHAAHEGAGIDEPEEPTFSFSKPSGISAEHPVIFVTPLLNAKPFLAKASKTVHTKKGYAGVLVATQFSSVKGQSFAAPAWSAGVFGGVKLRNQIALEGAIIVSRRSYSTDASYFNNRNNEAEMPTGMHLQRVSGKSFAIALPMTIKYNFSEGLHRWYVNGGLSSIILPTEKNTYSGIENGVQEKLSHTHHTNRSYIASSAYLGTGLEFQSASGHLQGRVETYAEIPLKGIGIGSVAATTAGIRFAVVLPGSK